MTRAYNPLYLEDAMNNLGSMLDCAVNATRCELNVFYGMFLASDAATQIAVGNPRYVSGLSGVELMQRVLLDSSDKVCDTISYSPFDRTPEYWTGWVLAYYQWWSNRSFAYLQRNGLDAETVLSLYPTLHEADLSKFTQIADALIEQHLSQQQNMLKRIRKQARITQRELSDLSGVTLRMIRAYEQNDQALHKAEARTVFALSQALGCEAKAICQ